MIKFIKRFIENSKDYIKEWGTRDYIIMILYYLLPIIVIIIVIIIIIIIIWS